jgi:hypothetical protein
VQLNDGSYVCAGSEAQGTGTFSASCSHANEMRVVLTADDKFVFAGDECGSHCVVYDGGCEQDGKTEPFTIRALAWICTKQDGGDLDEVASFPFTIVRAGLAPQPEADRIVCVESTATWGILAEGGSAKGKLTWGSEPGAAITVKNDAGEVLSQGDEVGNGHEVTVEAQDGQPSDYQLTLTHADLDTCGGTEAGSIIKVEFIRQNNCGFPDSGNGACHMVSKFVTPNNLPDTATFEGPEGSEPDPDTFRVQVAGLPCGESPKIRLEVIRGTTTQYTHEFNMVHGTAGGVSTYRTDEHIRLVSNDVDADRLDHQTPKVRLLDTVTAMLVLNGQDLCSTELPVALPSSEPEINAKRLAMLKFKVVDHMDVAANADRDTTCARMIEQWAQAAVTFGLTKSTVDPVTNVIRVQWNAVGSGDVSLKVNGTTVPSFTVGTAGRTGVKEIAEDIASNINAALDGGKAEAFYVYDEIAYVVVDRGNNAEIEILAANVVPTSVVVPPINYGDAGGEVGYDERRCLAANYMDDDPDTIDLFIVKYLPASLGRSNPMCITPETSDIRNSAFIVLSAGDADGDNPFTAAHEAGHLILNTSADQHDPDANNLMFDGTSSADGFCATKRLTSPQHQRSRSVNEGKILKP